MTLSLLSLKKPRRRSITSRSKACAEDLDAAGTKLSERRVDVGNTKAQVVVLLDAEGVVE